MSTAQAKPLLLVAGGDPAGTSLELRADIAHRDALPPGARPRDVTRLRDIAMVFQLYALYLTKSVQHNIGFPLKAASMPKRERPARAREVAEIPDLTGYLDRKPGKLSGGQRQRVAMGRAIVRRPQSFLLDESRRIWMPSCACRRAGRSWCCSAALA